MTAFLAELRRRHVFRVAGGYLVVAWMVIQVAALLETSLGLPGWFDAATIGFLALGFPVALILAWAFELTADGVKRTAPAEGETGFRPLGGTDFILIGLLVLVLGVAGFQIFTRGATEPPLATAPEAASTPVEEAETRSAPVAEATVAVLPFLAMSADPEDGYFADGLTEEILNSLAALDALLVTSRTSAFQFRGDDLPPLPEIARSLGVAHVVEGSVRRSGDQLRITAQLIRAADDAHLWSQTYDRTMEDVFAIQEEIAENIAAVLGVVLDDDQRALMAEARVENVEAFIAYQRGQAIVDAAITSFTSHEDLAPADPFFAEATALAPDFTDAFMARSFYSSQAMVELAYDDAEDAEERYQAWSRVYFDILDGAARSTRDENRLAMIAMDRMYFLQDWTHANEVIDRAAETRGCRPAVWLYEMTAAAQRSAEFLPFFQDAVRCAPLSQFDWIQLTAAALAAEEYDLALDAIDHGLALAPNSVLLRNRRADALYLTGDEEGLREFLARQGWNGLGWRVFIAAREGDRASAMALIENAGLDLEEPAFNPFILLTLAKLGERDAANRMAAIMDPRPMSYDVLLNVARDCHCGAPWDLEATPRLAARLEQAEFPWPPPGTGRYPLKDW